MALGHELRLLTRASATARDTGTETTNATDHNPLTARRSTAARRANNKLACGGSLADAAAANSAALNFGPTCWWLQAFRIFGLHAAAASGVLMH